MRRKKLPLPESPEGKACYGGSFRSISTIETIAAEKMRVFEMDGRYGLAVHYKQDKSYNWADEVRRKRRDAATRLQNRQGT